MGNTVSESTVLTARKPQNPRGVLALLNKRDRITVSLTFTPSLTAFHWSSTSMIDGRLVYADLSRKNSTCYSVEASWDHKKLFNRPHPSIRKTVWYGKSAQEWLDFALDEAAKSKPKDIGLRAGPEVILNETPVHELSFHNSLNNTFAAVYGRQFMPLLEPDQRVMKRFADYCRPRLNRFVRFLERREEMYWISVEDWIETRRQSGWDEEKVKTYITNINEQLGPDWDPKKVPLEVDVFTKQLEIFSQEMDHVDVDNWGRYTSLASRPRCIANGRGYLKGIGAKYAYSLIKACKDFFPGFIQGMNTHQVKEHVSNLIGDITKCFSSNSDISAFDSGRAAGVFAACDQPFMRKMFRTFTKWADRDGAVRPVSLANQMIDQGCVKKLVWKIQTKVDGKLTRVCDLHSGPIQPSGSWTTTLMNTLFRTLMQEFILTEFFSDIPSESLKLAKFYESYSTRREDGTLGDSNPPCCHIDQGDDDSTHIREDLKTRAQWTQHLTQYFSPQNAKPEEHGLGFKCSMNILGEWWDTNFCSKRGILHEGEWYWVRDPVKAVMGNNTYKGRSADILNNASEYNYAICLGLMMDFPNSKFFELLVHQRQQFGWEKTQDEKTEKDEYSMKTGHDLHSLPGHVIDAHIAKCLNTSVEWLLYAAETSIGRDKFIIRTYDY